MADANITESIARKHPYYDQYAPQWKFYRETYDGGRDWFNSNIFKYFKEGNDEYSERLERAYRFNHTREVVDLVNKYIFKTEIQRKEDAEEFVKRFWTNASIQKRDIDHFMTLASALSSIYGRVWIVIDSSKTDESTSVADAKRNDDRVYAYTVTPPDVLDLSMNDDGELNWIKIRENYREDADPFSYSGKVKSQIRIWTRTHWFLYKSENEQVYDAYGTYKLVESGEHGLGIVPVTYLDHNETDDPYISTALIADIAYLDRAAANYLSNLDTIIYDQTFSQLVIPADAMTYADDGEGPNSIANKMLEFGTKRIFLYNAGEGGNKPEYISPDPAQPSIILSVVNKIINEIYHSVGMAGERTKQDNAMGIDNSSGVAKAYDFERMNAMLANKAKSLEFCENRMIRLVKAWNNSLTKIDDVEEYVTYSRDFDVRNLSDEFDIANNLAIINAPKSVKQEQMKQLVNKLWPQLSKKLVDEINKDIENEWLKEEVVEANTTDQNLTTNTLPKSDGKQGQNNKPAKKTV